MSEAALAAAGLAVRYGTLLALDDATLEVRAGEMVGLMGPNGAGKSTLFRAALGLTRSERGTLHVLGQPVGSAGYGAVRPHVGYVAQKPPAGRFPVTVWEAVAMGRYGQAGVGRGLTAQDRQAVQAALQQLGIAALAERPVQRLSGGQAQRVTIARALAQEPRLLLLDEPTASLDREGQLDIARLIGALHRERGIAVAIVSHSLEVARLCQRLYYFDRGQVRALAGVEELPGYACA